VVSVDVLRFRLGAVAFAAAGVLFFLYPAARPWADEATVAGALQAMGSRAWVASHVFAMLGFVLVGLGVLAVRGFLSESPGGPLAGAAVVAAWAGAGLTLPYYGAEAFGLHAIATAADGQDIDLLAVVDGFRFDPVAITLFGLGLVALAAGAVLLAVAIRRSGRLPRHAGALFALGFVLFLPQFFTPPVVRIGHGVLVALGCVAIAVALWRSARTPAPVPAGGG
jgi:hypothetical protein